MASPGWGSPGRGCQLLPSRLQFVVRAPRLLLRNSAKGPVSRILSCAVIPLDAASPRTFISDLPGGFGKSSRHPSDENLSPGTPPEPPERIGQMRSAFWLLRALPSLFGLAPCGVYPAPTLTGRAVRSYRTISPLPDWPSRLSPFGPVVHAKAWTPGGIFSVALAVCWP